MKNKIVIFGLIAIAATGCSSSTSASTITTQRVEVFENDVPGTVRYSWEEPMYDTVEVQGQLDPTGTYYRVGHKTLVEINQGRVQPVEYPGSKPIK